MKTDNAINNKKVDKTKAVEVPKETPKKGVEVKKEAPKKTVKAKEEVTAKEAPQVFPAPKEEPKGKEIGPLDEPANTDEVELAKIALKLKKEHRLVYRTDIADTPIFWRPLKRSEYREILKEVDNKDNELTDDELIDARLDRIADFVVLYPDKEVLEEIAMASDIIGQQCMIKSGFVTNVEKFKPL